MQVSHAVDSCFFLVLGGRNVEHLWVNIQVLSLPLSAEDAIAIDKGYEFDHGFLHNLVNRASYAS